MEPVTPRCVGTIDGPVGDCDAEPVLVLVTMGFIDEDGQAFAAAAAVDELEPVPLAFCTCLRHKKPLVAWARRMWGAYFDGDLYPVSALPAIIEQLGSDGLPTAVNPDPSWALSIERVYARSAG